MSAILVDFLAGAVTLGFFVALAALLGAGDELTPYTYLLRVLGFVLLLYAIIDKNLSSSRGPRQQSAQRGIAHE